MNMPATDAQSRDGLVAVEALRFDGSASSPRPDPCLVIEEETLTLEVEGIGNYTLMYTPVARADMAHGYTVEDGLLGEVEKPEGLSLALGFLLSEGLIRQLADVRALSVCPDNTAVVKIRLQDPDAVEARRKNVVINSSCGICGAREILQDNALQLEDVPQGMVLEHRDVLFLMQHMHTEQQVFQQTGGAHAAAIFDRRGKVLAVAEDLGRHNALDKAVGTVLLAGGTTEGCGVVMSSRLSSEMVIKAVRAGLEIMAAVSAPTSLALDIADRFGLTLCGFVRDPQLTVYTHPYRIVR